MQFERDGDVFVEVLGHSLMLEGEDLIGIFIVVGLMNVFATSLCLLSGLAVILGLLGLLIASFGLADVQAGEVGKKEVIIIIVTNFRSTVSVLVG